jgi:imidazoleglycerol phosphate synthase glutamine amidotransferase subunit HisH
VHSYYPQVADGGLTVAETDHGVVFTSAFARGNIVAVQFHPEKSGRHGLRLLANFAGVPAPAPAAAGREERAPC